ncbi:MAG: hypothetical protein GY868_03585, partial [Deltaproteobacteria bacterium]|nr:hypothetical protein [Deltaproteobacteria bacterium]
MQNNSITWSIDERYSARFTQTVLNDIVTRNNCSQEKVVRSLTTRSVSLLKLTPPDLPDIYLKSYHIPPTKLYRSWLQPYGTKEWRVAQALTRSSISTCPPIALGLQKSFGLYRRAFFITEAVTDSLTLKEYIERCGTRSFSGYET